MKKLNERAIYFNKIYVIQSLPLDEIQTGLELYNDIIDKRTYNNSLVSATYNEVHNKVELFNLLNVVLEETSENSVKPYLHFETHGFTKGLVLKSGEKVEYWQLEDILRNINISSQNNLFISIGACWGGYIQDVTDIFKPCVFRGFIGPMDEIKTGDLNLLFNEFFNELLLTTNFDNAINVLCNINTTQVDFHCYRAESFFDKIVNEKRMDSYRWVRTLTNKIWQEHPEWKRQFKSKNEYLRFISPRLIEEEQSILAEIRKKYLHIDS